MAARRTAAGTAPRLSALLRDFAVVAPADDCEVTGLALDSRALRPGDVFLACAGTRVSGSAFIADAVAAGAVAVLQDANDPAAAGVTVPRIPVESLRERIGPIAARFHGEPSREMTVVGVTGTNGKTSCAYYLAQALAAGGDRCGLIGTLGYGEPGALRPGLHTTPDPLTLQAELARLRDAGVGHAAIEVSSHALEQHRVAGTCFAGAIFTNLSHDHLDYHADLRTYGLAKQKLFRMPGLRFAAINRDDAFGRELIAGLMPDIRCVAYGLGDGAAGLGAHFHIDAHGVVLGDSGLSFSISSSWGEGRLEAPLLGRFNARNLLAVLAALLMLDIPFDEALARLSAVRPVSGRMERFGGGSRPLVIVDYAHTPDALAEALAALRPHCKGRLWCVFGCGGSRDQAKRPLMGETAARLADRVVLTSDNPRDEDPEAIIAAIRAGIVRTDGIAIIADRARAIRETIAAAVAGDVVLVAGKGHEDYQILGDRRLAFSDQAEVKAALGGRRP